MICKDCIHYERCKLLADKQITYLFSGIEGAEENECFKDKSDFIELPRIKNVKPFVRGEWELHKDGSGTCTVCRTTQKDVWDMDSWQNFCGHCGADMRSEN